MGLAVSMLLSAVYFVSIPWHPFPASWLMKAAPVAILAVMAARKRDHALALGLAFSSVGDALLEYSPGLFVAGLVAFLLAHIAYTVTFVRAWRSARISAQDAALSVKSTRNPDPPRRVVRCFEESVAAIAVVLYSACLAAWLIPAVGALAIPVTIYVAAITAMVVSAITARFPSPWVATGAVLFLVSDSVLAVDRFRTPVPLAAWIVWATYYAAQVLIARGYGAPTSALRFSSGTAQSR